MFTANGTSSARLTAVGKSALKAMKTAMGFMLPPFPVGFNAAGYGLPVSNRNSFSPRSPTVAFRRNRFINTS